MMPSVPLIHQRSFAASVYEKQAGVPNTQSQPLISAGVTKRAPLKGPIAMIPLPPCRSCGHTTHKVAACPVLFYTDANNELHLEWKDSPMGKEWARHNYTTHSLDIALPGHEDQYLNRLQSEFHVSMLNPPRNDFKRTRFDNNIPGGQQQTGSSNPQQPMSNSQYEEQSKK